MSFDRKDRWARHYQEVWEERSGDPLLPKWLRIVAYAYGMHRANGHAPLRQGSKHGPGTLALLLTDPKTGEPCSRQLVDYHLKVAKRHGFLSDRSSSRCLVVPAFAIEGGLGNSDVPCPTCHPKTPRRRARG